MGESERETGRQRWRVTWGRVDRKWGREHSPCYKDRQNTQEKRRKTSTAWRVHIKKQAGVSEASHSGRAALFSVWIQQEFISRGYKANRRTAGDSCWPTTLTVKHNDQRMPDSPLGITETDEYTAGFRMASEIKGKLALASSSSVPLCAPRMYQKNQVRPQTFESFWAF